MKKIYYKHHSLHTKYSIPNTLSRALHTIYRILYTTAALPFKLLPGRLMRRLSSTQRLFVNMVLASIMLVFGVWIVTGLLNPEQSKAAWFNGNWLYRISVPITNGSGAELANYQILIATDTAQMITQGKLQSDCDDLRVVNASGAVLPHWVETGAKGCNTAVTNIWVKVPVIPTSGGQLFLYYGNTSATNVQNGNKVFELFDDFSGNSLDTTKWTTGTIGATSGTNFTVSGGLLSGGNTNRTITSVKSFTGNYSAESRTYTTTFAANGYTPVGFWASTSNGWAILDHNTTSYYRNDGAWPNIAYDGNSQWTRNTAKVVATTGTYGRVGETSGSIAGTAANSGISGENIRLSARSDNSATNQNYVATWDWILVRKAVATEPTTSISTEEQSPGPVAYWKFDEGQGSTVRDSTTNHNDGTTTGATWQTKDQCVSDKCLDFDSAQSDYVTIPNSNVLSSITNKITIAAWVKWRGNGSGGDSQQMIVGNLSGGSLRFGTRTPTTTGLFGFYCGTCTSPAWYDASPIPQNQWTYLVVTMDGSTIKMYQNGILTKTSTYAGNVLSSGQPWTLGAYSGTTYNWNGLIDETKIYPYARSVAQVQSDFTSRGSVKGVALQAGSENTSALSNGLVGYWKMDESLWNGTSNEVVDSSGNANHGTSVLGAEASPSAKFGKSGYFAGSDEAISVADSASLDLSDTLTISLWSKRNTISVNNYIIQKGGGPYAIGFNGSNQLYLDMPGTGNIFTSTAAFTDTSSFHHIVFAKKGASLLVYFDGAVVAGTFTNRTLANNSSALYLGSNSGNTAARYGGNMDEVRLYNRQLSPNEIQQLYAFAPGPVGYWNFEEGNGNSVNDSSSNANTGTWNGTLNSQWTQGKFGKGGKFNGTDNHVSVPYNNAFKFGTGDFTISWWANHTALSGLDTYYEDGFYYAGFLIRHQGEMGVYIQYATGSDYYGFPWVPTLGKWYHLTLKRQSGNLNFYVDGVQVSTTRTSLQNIQPSTPTFIGHSTHAGATQYFNGKLDEFRVYNYARTTGQIVSDMNADHPLGGSPVGSQALYYKFNEGYGTIAYDSSPQKNNGTLVGSPSWVDGQFNKGLSFNSSTKRVTIGTPFGQAGYTTATLWYRRTTDASGSWRDLLAHQSSNIHHLIIHSTTRSIGIFDGSFKDFGYVPPLDGKYHHYAVVYNSGSSASLYVDGVFKSTISTTLDLATYPIGSIGNWSSSYQAGEVDEIKIYSAALSAAEIKIDYNRGASLSLGSIGTSSDGKTATNSASAAYCVPGDTSTCSAPIAQYSFEEKSGASVQDISGNGNTATKQNTPIWVQGKIGSAMNFDDSADYLSVSGIAVGSTWTVSTWSKFPLAANGTYRTLIRQGANVHHILVDPTGLLGVYNSAFYSSGYDVDTLSAGWHHITAVGSGGSTTFYIDGKSIGTSAQQITTNITQIGGIGSQNWGTIDEMRIYNYARTASQIAYDYNRGKPVAWYKIDECQGSTFNDSAGGTVSAALTIGGSGSQTSAGTCSTASTGWGNGATGKFNSSFRFDGTDDFAVINNTEYLQATSNISASLWVKPNTLGSQLVNYPISKGIGGAAAQGWAFGINGTNNSGCANAVGKVYLFTNNTTICGSTISTGAWTHMVFTNDGTTTKIYINGILAGSGAQTIQASIATNINIGRRTDNNWYFNGQVDDVQVFNYTLTANQVKTLMNQGGSVRFGPNTGAP